MHRQVVLGPPGCGKTTTLLNILDAELASGTQPERIGFVSFTRKAAEEAAVRACDRFGLPRKRLPWFRTLHSLCFRQLGLRREDVLEGKRLQEFSAYANVPISGRWGEEGMLLGFESGDRIIFMENLSRVRGITLRQQYDEMEGDGLQWREVERVADALEVFKQQRALLDFTDMLAQFIASGITMPLDVLLVDEAQDLSRLQWRVVSRLTPSCRRVVVGADDDQAIFIWSGADVDQLIALPWQTTVLGQSYRVPIAVQDIANRIISSVKSRRPKDWRPRDVTGIIRHVARFSELELDDPDTGGPSPPVLVLGRNDYILKEQVEPWLRQLGILYERSDVPSVSLAVRDAITGWERLRKGGEAHIGECRAIYKFMSAGRGYRKGFKELKNFDDDVTVSMAELKQGGGLLTDEPWYNALTRIRADDVRYIERVLQRKERLRERPRVRLSTIHASKGGEADHVVLLTEMAKRTYREMELNPDAEARVFYTAVTRARERLTIVASQTPQAFSFKWL